MSLVANCKVGQLSVHSLVPCIASSAVQTANEKPTSSMLSSGVSQRRISLTYSRRDHVCVCKVTFKHDLQLMRKDRKFMSPKCSCKTCRTWNHGQPPNSGHQYLLIQQVREIRTMAGDSSCVTTSRKIRLACALKAPQVMHHHRIRDKARQQVRTKVTMVMLLIQFHCPITANRSTFPK